MSLKISVYKSKLIWLKNICNKTRNFSVRHVRDSNNAIEGRGSGEKRKLSQFLSLAAVVVAGLMTAPLLADSATGSITHVQLTPASVTLVTGTTQQYTAQALDSNNQPVSNVNYFWLVAAAGGSINACRNRLRPALSVSMLTRWRLLQFRVLL